MKKINIKKTKYEQVVELLERQGYILDEQTAKIFGHDKIYAVSEHKRIWHKLKSDREFFKDKKIYAKQKGHRCHLVKITKDGEFWYKVGKEFFNEVEIAK